jgi:hypothetical protein
MINDYNPQQVAPALPTREAQMTGQPISLESLMSEFTFITTSINNGTLSPNDPTVQVRIAELQNKITELQGVYQYANVMGMLPR